MATGACFFFVSAEKRMGKSDNRLYGPLGDLTHGQCGKSSVAGYNRNKKDICKNEQTRKNYLYHRSGL